MTTDPLERLRAADPARECPAPSIEPVWRRIELEESSPPEPHQRPGSTARTAGILRWAPGVLTVAVAVAVAVGLVVLLHGRNSAPPVRGPQPPASSQPAAISPAAARRELLKSLALLRRPQTAADRRAARPLGSGGLLPGQLAARSRAGVCRASDEHAPGCGTRIDRSLVRRLAVPHSRDTALVLPTLLTHAVSGMPRGQFGIVFALRAPQLGSSSDSMNGGGDTGEAVSSLPLTPVAAFERHGAIASYDVRSSGQWATGLDRIAVLVPDHVTRVTLGDLSLASPRTGRPIKRLHDLTAAVHGNVALMQIGDLTLTRLGHAVHGAAISSGTEGTRCTITARFYTVLATANVHWRRHGHTQEGGRVSFFLYVNAPPSHPIRSASPYCRR